MRLSVDEQPVVEQLDLYNPDPNPAGEVELGRHALSSGEHTLEVRIVAANEMAVKAYIFGIDYLRLEKIGATD